MIPDALGVQVGLGPQAIRTEDNFSGAIDNLARVYAVHTNRGELKGLME